MQALTQVAAQLIRENWSTAEDLFRAAVATVHHLKKRSQPYDSASPQPKTELHALHSPTTLRVRVAVTVWPSP